MNNTPEFNIAEFDSGSGKKIRSYFSRIGMGLTLMLLCSVGIQMATAALVRKYAPAIIETDWFIWVLSLAPMYLVGLPFMLTFAKKIPQAAPQKHKMKLGHWMIALLMSFGVLYAGNYIGSFITVFINTARGKETVNLVENALSMSSPLFSFIATVLIAPILEELVFRRFIINRTRAYGEKTAVVFSALLFGLYHGNIQQFFYAFGVGILFGYIYVRTGKVKYTVFLHMIINFFGSIVGMFVLKYANYEAVMEFYEQISQSGYMESIMQDMEAYNLYLARFSELLPDMLIIIAYTSVMGGLALAGAILMLVKRRKFVYKKSELQLPSDRVGSTVYMNIGVFTLIIVCAGIMLYSLL